jgi:hypothetical protein
MRSRILVATAILVSAGALGAKADYLTTTFGNHATCEHAGTLKFADGVLTFDLSALPADVTVARAVLRVPTEGHAVGAAVRVKPVGPEDAGELRLLGPLYRTFDATAAARAWVANRAADNGLQVVESGGVNFHEAVLEVSYPGKAARPIPAVTGLAALHQSGQTFVTWREIEDPVGKPDATFEELHNAVMSSRARHGLRYRVYRSSKPITAETLGQAELVREVDPILSCYNLKAVENTEHPNQGRPTMRSPIRPGYNNVRAYKMTRYRITSGGEPLPHATGLAVFTCTRPAACYYAVTASVNSREAVTALGPGASLAKPVEEKPSAFPAIVYQRQSQRPADRGREKPTVAEVYNSWLEPPYHQVPNEAETVIVKWSGMPEAGAENRRPLFVLTTTYGGTSAGLQDIGWHGARKHLGAVLTIGVSEGSVWQGWHECVGTLRGYDQGVVHNYPQRRVLAAARWGIASDDFFVDPAHVYFWSQLGCWALRHGDLFAVVMSNGYGNFAVGKLAQNHGRSGKWGPYPAGSENLAGVNQWEYMNIAKFVRENPTVELPYWLCWPAYGAYPSHTVGDFGFMPWPETIHAMHQTKRAFAAVWNSNGPGQIGTLRQFILRIRRDQSLPAFGHSSLDASPGDGDHADAEKSGGINLHQRWDPETIVDEPSRWEMTMYLDDGCGAESATMTVTPRRCQRFRAKPGANFAWTLAEGEKTVSKGTAVANQWGLVTAGRIELTKQPRRLRIAATE